MFTCLASPPASQCNPLFYSFLKDRAWLYLSIYRSEAAVERELEHTSAGDVRAKHIGVDQPVKNMYHILEQIETDRHVIVDTINPLEAKGYSEYADLVNGLKDYLIDTDRIALSHCTTGTPPALREVTLTMADIVFKLEFTDDVSTENRVTVPKYRCKEAVDEVIKLGLGQDVSVDTTRNIA